MLQTDDINAYQRHHFNPEMSLEMRMGALEVLGAASKVNRRPHFHFGPTQGSNDGIN